MNKKTVGVTALVLGAVIVFQFTLIGSMREEMAAVRSQLASLTGRVPADVQADAEEQPRLVPMAGGGSADLRNRLANLELAVTELTEATDALRERGALPLTERNIAEYKTRFADPTASDRDRFGALRMLRRNGEMSDDVVFSALNWMQTTTNANVRNQLVQNLDGMTNAAIKQPLMSMLATEQSSRNREEIVDTLSDFAGSDPMVADKLWELSQKDPDPNVREEALEALADQGSLSESRVALLQERAISTDVSVEDRLLAFQALREAEVDTTALTAQMVQMAQATDNPVERARIFGAFDGVSDESLKAPLVYGLQDPNPVVREQAADALAQFARTDPQVREWLEYVSQNDADPRVQREAYRALEQRGGDRDRRWRD